MPVVKVIPQKIDPLTKQAIITSKKRRVAAYARVSTDSDEQFTSFSAQVDYYTNLINSNPNWEMVDIYTDEGISGTNTKHRESFNKMIQHALEGKIDLIVTKSVSRFARNTVDSITTIRALKDKGVEVFFEKENIYTLDAKGELLITLMSSLAQEESRSISENVTWGFRKRFQDGKFSMCYSTFLGYDKGPDGKPIINEEEAKIVRQIYRWFLEGMSCFAIAEKLNEMKVPMPSKKKDKATCEYIYRWQCPVIISILSNEKYKGEAILQKTITVDFLTHTHKKNEGEAPQYHVTNSHEPIILPIEWEMVQDELKRRTITKSGKYTGASIFAGKLVCKDCGSFYGPKVWHSNDKYRRVIYRCNHKFAKKGSKCDTPTLDEEQIKTAFIESFNQLDNEHLIDDIEMTKEVAADTSEIDKAINKTEGELIVALEIAKRMVEENASTPLDQEEYLKKYKAVEERINLLNKDISELEAAKKKKLVTIGRLDSFKNSIINKEGILTSFDEKLWSLLVEKVQVDRNQTLTFIYYAGFKNEIKLQND